MAARHAKNSEPTTPRLSGGDPEAGAFVRIIEMKSSGGGDNAEKGERPLLRLKQRGVFPWGVLVPLKCSVSPRLRGLILLNLVRLGDRGQVPAMRLELPLPPPPPLPPGRKGQRLSQYRPRSAPHHILLHGAAAASARSCCALHSDMLPPSDPPPSLPPARRSAWPAPLRLWC